MNRGERHPIMDQSIAIDNNTLNSIINSILQAKNNANDSNNGINKESNANNNNSNAPELTPAPNNNATTGADGESQQYLLPVDLLISVDKSQHATVKAALPSTFAFQQPMIPTLPLQFASTCTTPLPSIPMVPSTTPSLTFTPSVNAYQQPMAPMTPMTPATPITVPALTTPTGLPSVPMVPSIPMSLLSQPQMPITPMMNTMNINQFMPQQMMFPQHHQLNKSSLNPSAQTFTPTTTYSAFGHNMNTIAPISENPGPNHYDYNDEQEQKVKENNHGSNGDGDDYINDETDAW
eukprot:CAMPEP_0201578274 /NCGR_PEP_ID=MMETSP0190_2-20130828/25062_1 /ASSEMBLY_ACC=CAM_ASM_000263 /TAXON_ID=37353 /ORGANISM="Rosalina sp." /LENGTH=292 /DNA_ID=CAMNT_0048011267 /DNA_START=168 /DNA_END=1043 /DNA_ORIENTATION=+